MDEKELYKQILGIVSPWEIKRIDLEMDQGRVDVYLEWPYLQNEGILSTFPAIVNVLIGVQAGYLLRASHSENRKMWTLILSGDGRFKLP